MTEVRFYHLLRDTTTRAVPDILSKALARNMRILLKLPDEKRRHFYDDWLWRFDPESFMPHAQEGDPMPEEHPIWLSVNDDAPNGAKMAFVIEGAELPVFDKFDLVCMLFDSENEDRLQQARERWAELKKQDGLTLTYWQQQEDGSWKQQNK